MISLVATVFNEIDELPRWLGSILAQSFLPDEIVIVDGGSIDGTWEWLQEKAQTNIKLSVFRRPGNIAVGRNFAIQHAKGDVIAVADAGCFYFGIWLEKLVKPLLTGDYRFSTTAFGPWLKDEDSLLVRLIAASTTPAKREFCRDWLPSSRSVAFHKKLWQDVGGYPEWIPYCEDVIFDLAIKDKREKCFFVREPLALWRPRKNLRLYFLQLFRYTRSDGHGNLWLHRQLIRYLTYSIVAVLLILSYEVSLWFLVALLLGIFIYIRKFWLRWLEFSVGLSVLKRLLGLFLLPIIIMWGDVAKMSGWPVGIYERLFRKIKFQ